MTRRFWKERHQATHYIFTKKFLKKQCTHFFPICNCLFYLIVFFSAHLIGDGNDGAPDPEEELKGMDFDNLQE